MPGTSQLRSRALAILGRAALNARRVEESALIAAVLADNPHLLDLQWDPRTSYIDYPNLRVGRRCSIGGYAYVYGPVSFGDDVMIAMHCGISAGAHRFDIPGVPIRDSGGIDAAGIVIEDDVWLGHGVIITDGVRIGHGSVIAAGSIVTKDIPPLVVAAGGPCVPIRDRFRKASETDSAGS
jgi:acetyltransferase-like isoleucine patch superfamily enzyme